MGNHLKDKLVKELDPPASGQRIIYDDEVIGFGIRVTAAGSKSFVLRYVMPDAEAGRRGSEYRYTIGAYPTWSVEAARAEAKLWRRKIDSGAGHPMAERKGRREAAKQAREAETYKEAVADYIAREQRGRRKNRTADQVERGLLVDGKSWHDKPVASLTAKDIRRQLETIRDGDEKADPPMRPRPYLANRFHAYLGAFFRWCAEPGIDKIPLSPMLGLKRPWEGEQARDRFFNDVEIVAIWKAADAVGGTAGALVKVALLTGKRRGALAAMRWDELDESGFWTPPGETRRKKSNKRLHAVPLSKLAQRVIAGIKPADDAVNKSPWVFASRQGGTHVHPGTTLQTRMRRESGVSDFIMHSCRHTVETRMAELRVPPHIRDMILDHAPARGSGAGYDHYSYSEEIRDALELWAAHIEKLVAPQGVRVLR